MCRGPHSSIPWTLVLPIALYYMDLTICEKKIYIRITNYTSLYVLYLKCIMHVRLINICSYGGPLNIQMQYNIIIHRWVVIM